MTKLGLKMLFARWKWLSLITISLGITIACIISLMTASEAIKISLQKNAFENYGEHSGLLFGINESKSSLENNNYDVGEYQLIDTLIVNESITATIGWMERDAVSLGHINLLKGVFPSKENEVAIEAFYLKKIDANWQIGEKRDLLIGNKVQELKLVGIVKDYSAKWTVPHNVEKGFNDLPNLFISNKSSTSSSGNNFLIKFHKDRVKNEEAMAELLESHNNKGAINDRLFYSGLAEYENMTKLTVLFQIVILVVSIFCFWSLFYYFNIFQIQKDAQLKALGSSNINLFNLHSIQCLIIFLLSLLVSIPFTIIFHKLIIKNTFLIGDLDFSQENSIISSLAIWIVVLFIIFILISTISIIKFRKNSINDLIHSKSYNQKSLIKLIYNPKSFFNKQLLNQVIEFPKQSFLIISTLCLSILVILFSFFFQKESLGVWDAKQDYYIDSQELLAYEEIQNLKVLINKGLTFSEKEVSELEQTAGVKYLDKNPFMMDVQPLIDPKLITPSINNWIIEFDSIDKLYKEDVIIPSVDYQLIDEKEFNKVYKNGDYSNFKNKIILSIPEFQSNPGTNNNNLVGKNISFIKMFRESGQLKTEEWEFEVFDVIENFSGKISDGIVNSGHQFTIIFDKESAINSKIFMGYKDITVYVEDDLSINKEGKIDTLVYDMIAAKPGSLYQKITSTKEDYSRISLYIGYLGKMSFLSSLFLSMISIVSILLSKYYIKKRTWGIYLSLGMRKQVITKLLTMEVFLYFLTSIIVSAVIFFIFMNISSHIYPTSFYIEYYLYAMLFIVIIASLGIYTLTRVIKNQSILSLLKVNE